MTILFKIMFKSVWNRKLSFFLTVFSIALSILLFIGIERVRLGAKESFSGALSQTDLIVGARGGGLQLLLYSVFHLGNATHNISWNTYETIKQNPKVLWTIPISLGDSFRGFRVVATDSNFYEHYRFMGDKRIVIERGSIPLNRYSVVLGSEVQEKEVLKIGDTIALTHGVNESFSSYTHSDKPFTIEGVIQRTGTPIDRAIFITLEGMEAIHQQGQAQEIKIEQITAFLLRAKSRINALGLQREINDFKVEPLTAIIPGVVLSELWESLSYVEVSLKIVTISVVFVGLIGMMVAIYSSLDLRRREIAILRALGTSLKGIFVLLVGECFLISFLGCVLGILLSYITLVFIQPIVLNKFGIFIPITFIETKEYLYLFVIIVLSCFLGIIPAFRAYKNSLIDGLSIRM